MSLLIVLAGFLATASDTMTTGANADSSVNQPRSESSVMSAVPTPATSSAPRTLTTPGGPSTRIMKGRTLKAALAAYDRNDFNRALEGADAVVSQFPEDTPALTLLGACLLKRGDTDRAITVFSRYVDLQPLDAIGHYHLGLACQIAGRIQQSRESYKTAILLKGDFRAARKNLDMLDGR